MWRDDNIVDEIQSCCKTATIQYRKDDDFRVVAEMITISWMISRVVVMIQIQYLEVYFNPKLKPKLEQTKRKEHKNE